MPVQGKHGTAVRGNNSPRFRNTSLLGKAKRPPGQADSTEVKEAEWISTQLVKRGMTKCQLKFPRHSLPIKSSPKAKAYNDIN